MSQVTLPQLPTLLDLLKSLYQAPLTPPSQCSGFKLENDPRSINWKGYFRKLPEKFTIRDWADITGEPPALISNRCRTLVKHGMLSTQRTGRRNGFLFTKTHVYPEYIERMDAREKEKEKEKEKENE